MVLVLTFEIQVWQKEYLQTKQHNTIRVSCLASTYCRNSKACNSKELAYTSTCAFVNGLNPQQKPLHGHTKHENPIQETCIVHTAYHN